MLTFDGTVLPEFWRLRVGYLLDGAAFCTRCFFLSVRCTFSEVRSLFGESFCSTGLNCVVMILKASTVGVSIIKASEENNVETWLIELSDRNEFCQEIVLSMLSVLRNVWFEKL